MPQSLSLVKSEVCGTGKSLLCVALYCVCLSCRECLSHHIFNEGVVWRCLSHTDARLTANWAWGMYPGLALGAANTLSLHGTEAQNKM
jgi:hypothetical protein